MLKKTSVTICFTFVYIMTLNSEIKNLKKNEVLFKILIRTMKTVLTLCLKKLKLQF